LKGTGFSPYISQAKSTRALAPEGIYPVQEGFARDSLAYAGIFLSLSFRLAYAFLFLGLLQNEEHLLFLALLKDKSLAVELILNSRQRLRQMDGTALPDAVRTLEQKKPAMWPMLAE
jgi:hypothetical protein